MRDARHEAASGCGSEWGHHGRALAGDEPKSKHFTVRVSRATFAAFDRYATAHDTTATALLRDFIDGLLTRSV